MRKLYYKDGSGFVFVADTRTVLSIYRKMFKRWVLGMTDLAPAILSPAGVNMERRYGLSMDFDEKVFRILSAETVLDLLIDDFI